MPVPDMKLNPCRNMRGIMTIQRTHCIGSGTDFAVTSRSQKGSGASWGQAQSSADRMQNNTMVRFVIDSVQQVI